MRLLTCFCVVLPLIAGSICVADVRSPASDGGVYEQPTRPLDERVSKDKVTECDPPPLPETVIMPMPPTFRIATEPAQLPISAEHYEKAMAAIKSGLAYLRRNQDESGGWMTDVMTAPTDEPDKPSPVAVAVTAMVLKSIVQCEPETRHDPPVRRAILFVMAAKRDDGAFDGGALTNYVTSIVVSCLAAFEGREFDDDITDATNWLKAGQWDQSEGLSPRQDWFGGAGYGNRGRPDMSNTQMMLDALYDAGLSPDEPAFQRALAFVSRAQNLQATNKAEWAGNDGGFIYTPANGGESMGSQAAGEGRHGENLPEGEARMLRSYGSMTYAGFKSLLYAGLSTSDIRVRAAFEWIRRHWTFDENPGLGDQGLYYYCHTVGRALKASQQDMVDDVSGGAHNWREELIDALCQRQGEDGSWCNEADRWLESQPGLATVYSVLALEEALKPTRSRPAGGDSRSVGR